MGFKPCLLELYLVLNRKKELYNSNMDVPMNKLCICIIFVNNYVD